MKKIFKKPFVYWFIGIFIFYLILNILTSGFYETIPLIVIYANTVNWLTLGISLLLTLIIGFLVAFISVLAYVRYKERKQCKEGVAVASVGGLGGLAVGVCPLCVTGIFPLLLSFFGISFSFGSLPFQGMEVQLIIIIFLLISLYMLTNHNQKLLK